MKRTVAFSLMAVTQLATLLFAADTNTPRKAPELAFTVPGDGQRLLSQYRGKVVALEFILTTCPHCQDASHMMTRFEQQYGSQGFQALDVAINGLDEGRNESQATDLVAAFSRNFGVGFPVGWVPRDQFLAFMGFSLMERIVVPQLVMIDRKGFIRYQTPGKGDETSMLETTIRSRIEELLAAGAPASTRSHGPSHTATKRGS